ncbi:MAG TPA: aldose epimerase family protein [Povalibacter sp.]|nr:aldose epimerase family protein [Povalibacter sp.]
MQSYRPRFPALLLIFTLGLAACDKPAPSPVTEKVPAPAAVAKATATRAPFGALPDGTAVEAITLTNASGATVTAITYGGIITSIKVPDRQGRFDDVVLGHDTLDAYLKDGSYFGAVVGRYANRIGGAQFSIDGQTYKLAANNGPNSLHGGLKGFDKAVWHAEPFERDGNAGVVLTHTSPDGEEGFPGTLTVSVTYTFNDRNELAIDYQATTDKPTVFNPTNHSYFNLGGDGSGDVLAHELTIYADQYTPVDKTLVPTGELASVAGTPLDFRSKTAIGARIGDESLKISQGYDNNFVVNRSGPGEVKAARVEDPKSGRVMEVSTTEPGVQLYVANHQNGNVGKSGHVYQKYNAVCLEAEHYPDSPNKSSFPSTALRPGETFKSRTVYAFGVK